jgi:alpha-tubulin suppressor-like RCC1 family protein
MPFGRLRLLVEVIRPRQGIDGDAREGLSIDFHAYSGFRCRPLASSNFSSWIPCGVFLEGQVQELNRSRFSESDESARFIQPEVAPVENPDQPRRPDRRENIRLDNHASVDSHYPLFEELGDCSAYDDTDMRMGTEGRHAKRCRTGMMSGLWAIAEILVSSLKPALYGFVLIPLTGLAQAQPFGRVIVWTQTNQVASPYVDDAIQVVCSESTVVALRKNGTLLAWDDRGLQQQIPAGTAGIVQVAASRDHFLALTTGGTVIGWGNNLAGQTTPPVGLTGVKQVAATQGTSLALLESGEIVWWGDGGGGQPTPPPEWATNFVEVAVGYKFAVGRRTDGSVHAWGANFEGQTNLPVFTAPVTRLAAQRIHGLALQSDGVVRGWGYNYHSQTLVPAGLTAVAIACSENRSLAINTDGLLVEWGEPHLPPAGLTNLFSLAASSRFTAVIQRTGVHITAHPEDKSVTAGGSVAFSVTAETTTGLSYQWYWNGVVLAGATQSTLQLTSASVLDAGQYSVLVSGPEGSVSSRPAELVVASPPVIVGEPNDLSVLTGQPIQFSVSVMGSTPMTGLWFKDGMPLAGRTQPFLLIANSTFSDAGTYQLRLTNALGSAASRLVNVSIRLPALQYSWSSGELILNWPSAARLQSATNVLGPYEDVAGSAAPLVVNPVEAQRFFRTTQ